MNVFEMEGFLRGKCLPGDMKVNETTAEYLVRKLGQSGELTAAHSTIEKAREVTNCPQGVELQDHLKQLVAENIAKQEFIQFCFRSAADGASLDGADIQELGERLGLFGRETYQPVLHGYICGHEAGEDTVYVMKKTPATDSILREAEARARIEGINFAASRLAAAYNHGFIDKPLPEVFDVVRMILTAKEDLANTPAEDGLSGEYAEHALKGWEVELREGKS